MDLLKRIKLKNEWLIVEPIGDGGFGRVYKAVSGQRECALKLVPKVPGADRELLAANLVESGAVNIVPILEFGEVEGKWAMLMPLAECSLRERLNSGRTLPLDEALIVLHDICTALASIQNKIVHRDIKPENILLLDGKWCLSDFGIARYAEASTDIYTKKYAFTQPYTAPERWRFERATSAADVYSFGVVAYEILTGRLPFEGPDFREQHLHSEAPAIEGVPASIAAVIDECLYKSPGARPLPSNMIARLKRAKDVARSSGRQRLADANLIETRKRAEKDRIRSLQHSEAERRAVLFEAAEMSLKEISLVMLDVIAEDAPNAVIKKRATGGWYVKLGEAKLKLLDISEFGSTLWGGWDPPVFDVIAGTSLELIIPENQYGWQGRSHALWFCDASVKDSYAWYETAFMLTPLGERSASVNPFSLLPGEKAAKAIWMGLAEFQVAWPFQRLERGDIGVFVDRWAGWFADAAVGRLSCPRSMPEHDPSGSWRVE